MVVRWIDALGARSDEKCHVLLASRATASVSITSMGADRTWYALVWALPHVTGAASSRLVLRPRPSATVRETLSSSARAAVDRTSDVAVRAGPIWPGPDRAGRNSRGSRERGRGMAVAK